MFLLPVFPFPPLFLLLALGFVIFVMSVHPEVVGLQGAQGVR